MLGELTDKMLQIPDEVGTVLGWRSWDLNDDGLLQSPTMISVWRPGEAMTATHARSASAKSRLMQRLVGVAPDTYDDPEMCDSDCGCGINAWDSRERMVADGSYSRTPVYGSVNMWGRVRQYKAGVRTQHAYPAELFVDPDRCSSLADAFDKADQLSAHYGVPVHVQARSAERPITRSAWAVRRARMRRKSVRAARAMGWLGKRMAVPPCRLVLKPMRPPARLAARACKAAWNQLNKRHGLAMFIVLVLTLAVTALSVLVGNWGEEMIGLYGEAARAHSVIALVLLSLLLAVPTGAAFNYSFDQTWGGVRTALSLLSLLWAGCAVFIGLCVALVGAAEDQMWTDGYTNRVTITINQPQTDPDKFTVSYTVSVDDCVNHRYAKDVEDLLCEGVRLADGTVMGPKADAAQSGLVAK